MNFRTGLVKALVAAGYEVIAAAPRDQYCARLEALGCRFVPLPLSASATSPLGDFFLFLAYLRLMRRERPLAFVGFTIKPNIYGSLAAHCLKIPVINNIAGLGTAFLSPGWLNRLVKFLYRGALGRARVVFFQNPDDRDLFLRDRLVTATTARLLPGSGVDTTRFAPMGPASGRAPGEFTFLMVARMLWAKGVGEYVAAAQQVRALVPGARFKILGIVDEGGKGAIDRATIAGWERAGIIEFLGAADDVRPHMANADCIVLPTFYPEGTPRTLLEGAAMAKPLIATNVPGCREIVRDGLNGWLVPPKDPDALGAAMIRLVQMPDADLAAMGAASRVRARQEFDEQIVVRNYLEAIEGVGAGGG